MTFLIDTHILIWVAVRPRQIPPWAKALLEDLSNKVLVSAASIYEIGYKVRAGKLPDVAEFERDLLGNVAAMGYTIVDLSPVVMLRAARFAAEHGDPFDRMIAAQAIHLDLELLSVDDKMDTFVVRRLKAPVGNNLLG